MPYKILSFVQCIHVITFQILLNNHFVIIKDIFLGLIEMSIKINNKLINVKYVVQT